MEENQDTRKVRPTHIESQFRTISKTYFATALKLCQYLLTNNPTNKWKSKHSRPNKEFACRLASKEPTNANKSKFYWVNWILFPADQPIRLQVEYLAACVKCWLTTLGERENMQIYIKKL